MNNILPTDRQTVVDRDLAYIIECLHDELKSMAGKKLLITGGGGFLGYYLTQTMTFWNQQHDKSEAVGVTVYDNYSRGTPQWLQALGQAEEN